MGCDPKRGWNRVKTILGIVFLLWGIAFRAESEEIHFFSLEGEGTASLIQDDGARVAYLTDGGNPGSTGIAAVLVEGVPLLEYLTPLVDTLVITCTHPHRDHLGGLTDLIRSPAMLQFAGSSSMPRRKLVFVDSPAAQATGKTLYEIFRDYWGERSSLFDAKHLVAAGSDVFADLRFPNAEVAVSNFPGLPADQVGSVHDQSIILKYRLGDESAQQNIVDFDDASLKLIRAWLAANEDTKIDVLVVPHHGSAANDISPLLPAAQLENLRVVFTVNQNNRYAHPTSAVLQNWADLIGPQNVYLTSGEENGGVRINPRGTFYQKGSDVRRALLDFIRLRQEKLRARIASLTTVQGSFFATAHKNLEKAIASYEELRKVAAATLHGRAYPRLAAALRQLPESLRDNLHPQMGRLPKFSSVEPDLAGKKTLPWQAGLRLEELAAVAFLPDSQALPAACLEYSHSPVDLVNCWLVESWSDDPDSRPLFLVFDPQDRDTIQSLAEEAENSRLTPFWFHSESSSEPNHFSTDMNLATELLSASSDFFMFHSASLKKHLSEDCLWECAAQMLPQSQSRWQSAFRIKTKGADHDRPAKASF